MQFYYNVSLPHFGLMTFLMNAESRYMKFLQLKKWNRDSFLVPMYDIDLMWHSHQLAPKAYHTDLFLYLGFFVNHDDTSTDRSPGSHLNESHANTRRLWIETFKEEYAIPGVGYRGPDPRGKLYQLSQHEVDAYRSKLARVKLDSVAYESSNHAVKLKGSVKLVHYDG